MYLLLSQHRAASSLVGYLKAGTGGVLVAIKVKSMLRVRMRRFRYLAENSLPLIKLFCMWELCTALWSIHIPFWLDRRRLESVDGRTRVIDISKHHTTHSSASQPSTSRPREKEKKNSIWKQHKLCWILHFMQLWAAQLWINCLESPPVAPAVAGFFFGAIKSLFCAYLHSSSASSRLYWDFKFISCKTKTSFHGSRRWLRPRCWVKWSDSCVLWAIAA